MSLEFEIEGVPIVNAIVSPGRQGEQGIPGPNVVTTTTETPLSGVLVGDAGNVRSATPGEVISASDMQSALPCPTRIRSGRTYKTVEDQQVGFRLPIVIEAGASLVMSPGSTLYQN